MKKQQGFTLIELIIVIVILGILAVTVAPKFLGLQSEAKASTLEGVKGALASSAATIYAKSALEGESANAYDATATTGCVATTACVVTINSNNIPTDFGYIAAEGVTEHTNASTFDSNIGSFLDVTLTDWVVKKSPNSDSNSFAISPAGTTTNYSDDTKACHVLYTNSTGKGISPTIAVKSQGC